MSDNTQDVNERLDLLESKIDHVDTAVNELTQTLADAMMLFSQSEKGQYVELIEGRFQSDQTGDPRITSRYRRTQYAVAGLEI